MKDTPRDSSLILKDRSKNQTPFFSWEHFWTVPGLKSDGNPIPYSPIPLCSTKYWGLSKWGRENPVFWPKISRPCPTAKPWMYRHTIFRGSSYLDKQKIFCYVLTWSKFGRRKRIRKNSKNNIDGQYQGHALKNIPILTFLKSLYCITEVGWTMKFWPDAFLFFGKIVLFGKIVAFSEKNSDAPQPRSK